MAKRIISIRIDENLKREIDRYIAKMRKTQTEIIKEALKELLKKVK